MSPRSVWPCASCGHADASHGWTSLINDMWKPCNRCDCRDYASPPEGRDVVSHYVVRAIGSGQCHVADVDEADLMEITAFGSTGRCVALDPVVTRCGAQLKESRGLVVVMTKSKVNCRACRVMSGVVAVADGVLVYQEEGRSQHGIGPHQSR